MKTKILFLTSFFLICLLGCNERKTEEIEHRQSMEKPTIMVEIIAEIIIETEDTINQIYLIRPNKALNNDSFTLGVTTRNFLSEKFNSIELIDDLGDFESEYRSVFQKEIDSLEMELIKKIPKFNDASIITFIKSSKNLEEVKQTGQK